MTQFPQPWNVERSSIYEFIQSHIIQGQFGLPDDAYVLPDEKERPDEEVRWAAGALDGVMTHHLNSEGDTEKLEKIYEALKAAAVDRSVQTIADLYTLLCEDNTLNYIDHLINALIEHQNIEPAFVYDLSIFLATQAPDRGPVKFAIAMLGIIDAEGNTDLFFTLGRHEEFTLYCETAMSNLPDAEQKLWELARHVNGWGRIHIVERLAGTDNSEIKAWFLREGYRNNIMYEYLAYIVAVDGELLRELEEQEVDDALIIGASEILEALINGGPAADISHYEDAAETVNLFLDHLAKRQMGLREFSSVFKINEYVEAEDVRQSEYWTEDSINDAKQKSRTLLQRQDLKELILSGLKSDDEFWLARILAEKLGIDTWHYSFNRQKEGKDEWFNLMRTDDPARIDQVIQLAEELIPLKEVATGPAQEWGIGPEYSHHSAVDFIVQDLGRFPGKGWSLIKISIMSPVIRNRNMAVNALLEWGQSKWPEDGRQILETAINKEPEDEVKERMIAVLEGRDLPEG